MEKQHKKDIFPSWTIYVVIVLALLVLFNQWQIASISKASVSAGFTRMSFAGNTDLDKVDVTQIQSTAQAVAALFPVNEIKTTQDAINIMIPTGTPDYGQAMGVSFDDPLNSLNFMEKAYPALKQQAQQNPEIWQRYLNLAAAPRGISCEFCCGVGAQGIDAKGNMRCGCNHNPAIQSLTMWLMMNTDYSDAQVLKEVMRWKSLWFPRNMVELATKIGGGDTSVLQDLPGMVGGC